MVRFVLGKEYFPSKPQDLHDNQEKIKVLPMDITLDGTGRPQLCYHNQEGYKDKGPSGIFYRVGSPTQSSKGHQQHGRQCQDVEACLTLIKSTKDKTPTMLHVKGERGLVWVGWLCLALGWQKALDGSCHSWKGWVVLDKVSLACSCSGLIHVRFWFLPLLKSPLAWGQLLE